jgi:hypothetical protein
MVRCGDKLILYGGWTKSSPNPIHQTTMFFNEVNIYDPTTNMWTLVCDTHIKGDVTLCIPGARRWHGAAPCRSFGLHVV